MRTIVDIHPHVVSTDTDRYPITPLQGKRSEWSKKRSVTFEELIAAMDEAGVDRAAVVHSSTTYGYDCSYLADSVAVRPERVTGVFSVDMMAADAPEKIRYWAKERKLGGLRLYTAGGTHEEQSTWMSDPRVFRGLECARELGLPVCVSLRPAGVPQLVALVERLPDVRFVVDHMMEPPIAEGPPYDGSRFLFDLAAHGNLYLKLTTLNVRASRKEKGSPETFFPLLVEKFGASRIAWGSNYPSAQGTLKEMVAEARSALGVLPERDQEWIFARTAQSLYPALANE
jgi:predicted TIM-barrel fold metal-dependent hydrolase